MNVVVYKFKDECNGKKMIFEIIIWSVTRNSACIRDVNHNLSRTSHEVILFMLTLSPLQINVPSFQQQVKIKIDPM